MRRAIFLTLCISFSMIQDINAQGLTAQDKMEGRKNHAFNVIPKTPEAAQFELYGNTPVDHATGVPQISIPIYTIQVDGVSIPISLSYHASGIKVDELPSAVGLKWTLNAGGSVYRNINGLADEEPDDDSDGTGWWANTGAYMPDATWDNGINCYQALVQRISLNDFDVTPDDFGYSFGGYQGDFYFDQSKNIYLTELNDLTFEYPDNLSYFTAYDERGNEYSFIGAQEHTNIDTKQDNKTDVDVQQDLSRSGNGVTGWKLNSITTKNNKKISFSYDPYIINYEIVTGTTYQYKPDDDGKGEKLTRIDNVVDYTFTNQLIKKITGGGITIDFIYTQEDESLSIWKKRLKRIIVQNMKGEIIKQFWLEQGEFTTDKYQLKKLIEVNKDESNGKVYEFEYEDGSLPAAGSMRKDIFGYYNGQGNTHLVPGGAGTEFTPANRSIYESSLKRGVLSQINYPTGGYTKFTYELNKELQETVNRYAPGLRVSKIVDYDEKNKKYNIKEYTYSGLNGNLWTENVWSDYTINYASMKSESSIGENSPMYNNNIVLHSSNKINLPSSPGWEIQGYYYSNITIAHYSVDPDENNPDEFNYSVEETYAGYTSNAKYKTYLGLVTYKDKDGDPVKVVDYDYSGQTPSETLSGTTVKGYRIKNSYTMGGVPGWTPLLGCGSGDAWEGPTFYTGINTLSWKSKHVRKDKETITEYSTDGSGTIVQVTEYDYNSSQMPYTSPKMIEQYIDVGLPEPKQQLRTTKFKYVNDYSTAIPIITSLTNDNKNLLLIEKHIFDDQDKIIGGESYNYDENGNVIETYQLQNTEPFAFTWDQSSLVQNNFYKRQGIIYDNGFIAQLKDYGYYTTDGTNYSPTVSGTTSYKWDFVNYVPTAKIVNASFDESVAENFERVYQDKGVSTEPNVRVEGISKTGSHCTKAIYGNFYNTLNITLTAGEEYIISYWTKKGTSTGSTNIQVGTTQFTSTPPTSGEWKLVENKYTPTTSGEKTIYILIGDLAANDNGINENDFNYVDDLRIYPSDAQIESYHIEPGIGITNQTDLQGISTSYEYDDFNRLVTIRDHENNILEHYDYNMKDLAQFATSFQIIETSWDTPEDVITPESDYSISVEVKNLAAIEYPCTLEFSLDGFEYPQEVIKFIKSGESEVFETFWDIPVLTQNEIKNISISGDVSTTGTITCKSPIVLSVFNVTNGENTSSGREIGINVRITNQDTETQTAKDVEIMVDRPGTAPDIVVYPAQSHIIQATSPNYIDIIDNPVIPIGSAEQITVRVYIDGIVSGTETLDIPASPAVIGIGTITTPKQGYTDCNTDDDIAVTATFINTGYTSKSISASIIEKDGSGNETDRYTETITVNAQSSEDVFHTFINRPLGDHNYYSSFNGIESTTYRHTFVGDPSPLPSCISIDQWSHQVITPPDLDEGEDVRILVTFFNAGNSAVTLTEAKVLHDDYVAPDVIKSLEQSVTVPAQGYATGEVEFQDLVDGPNIFKLTYADEPTYDGNTYSLTVLPPPVDPTMSYTILEPHSHDDDETCPEDMMYRDIIINLSNVTDYANPIAWVKFAGSSCDLVSNNPVYDACYVSVWPADNGKNFDSISDGTADFRIYYPKGQSYTYYFRFSIYDGVKLAGHRCPTFSHTAPPLSPQP